jgi:hypothetical protein
MALLGAMKLSTAESVAAILPFSIYTLSGMNQQAYRLKNIITNMTYQTI